MIFFPSLQGRIESGESRFDSVPGELYSSALGHSVDIDTKIIAFVFKTFVW